MRYERKVAFLLPSMTMGGVSKMLLDILRDLKDSTCKVEILLLNREGEMLEQLPEWVTVKSVAGIKDLEGLRKNISNLLNRLGLKPLFHVLKGIYHRHGHLLISKRYTLVNDSYDVVVAFQDGMATWYAAKNLAGTCKLAVIHTDFEKAQYDASIEMKIYGGFDGIYCTSQSARESFLRCLPEFAERTQVLLPHIDCADICRKAAIFNGVELSTTGVNIVTVARLSHEKGIDKALSVLGKLLVAGYNVHWYFIGDGVDRDRLEALAIKLGCKDNAVFTGKLDNPYRTMAVADIYVQPSKYESYCIALAEARALGCAIVTTDFPSAHEQLDHGGGIISGTTEQNLFDSIKILIDDPEERKKIALQNRELFCEDIYKNNRLVQDIKDLFKGEKL